MGLESNGGSALELPKLAIEAAQAESSSAAAAAAALLLPALTPRRTSRYALSSMALLVLQGTCLSIALRYSRTRPGQPYLASVSVLVTELAKLAICSAVQLRECAARARAVGEGFRGEARREAREIAAKALPMLLPAGMFVMQQLLLVVAATHLDAVAFQIFSQSFKLVPTALFARWLLGQRLDPMQWASIPVLAAGVILVTLNNSAGAAPKLAAAAAAAAAQHGELNWVLGMATCSISGLSSAYAGVYFEKYVKGRHAATSLWVRNIQLGLFGVPLSAGYALLRDGAAIRAGGWMQGFDAATWGVVALQVFGGLVTGMVVKFCDNILKNFALAVSVILTVLVVIPLFGQWPSPFFLVGVCAVLLSVFMYGKAVALPDMAALRALLHSHKLQALLPWHADDGPTRRYLTFIFLGSSLTALLLLGAVLGQQRLLQWHDDPGLGEAGGLGARLLQGARDPGGGGL